VTESPTAPLEPPLLPRVGKTFALFLIAIVVIGGGWVGFRMAKLQLALARAHRELARKDLGRAEFWTGQALSVDERNAEAARMMAEISEMQDQPAALTWRIRVAQREPGSTGDIMAWAKCALRFGQGQMAFNALNSLPPDFKDHSAEYHELMAGWAVAARAPGLAEAHFVKAAELDHENPLHRVNLAAFRLTNSSNPELRAAAARDLEALAADPKVTFFAVRTLLADAIRHRDAARARRFAEKLRALPGHTFGDELSCLESGMAEPALHHAIEELEHRAASDPALATQLGDSLNSHGLADETLRWFAALPEPVRSNVRVQITAAEAYLAKRDWDGLENFLAKREWGDGEYLRRAMLIRTHRERSQPWEREWKQLVTDVSAKQPEGFLLSQLLIGWKWRDEALELLWDAATQPRTGSKALRYLWDLYAETNETANLLRVAKAQIDIDPSNPTNKNNVAFLSLMLYGASERAERLAGEISAMNPKIPEWAATYAYALHLAGKEAEAKKVMEKLPPEALGRPGIALYYAIVLAANGDNDRAKESFAKLNPRGMLPEERKLAAALAQQLNVTAR
jgi:hypothetical protein